MEIVILKRRTGKKLSERTKHKIYFKQLCEKYYLKKAGIIK